MTAGQTPAPTRGVPVVLDRERRLRFTFATRRKMIEEMGGEERFLNEGLSGEKLIKVLWYGLRHEDASLTLEQLEELVDMENIGEVVDKLLRAMGYKGKLVMTEDSTANPPPAAAAESASSP